MEESAQAGSGDGPLVCLGEALVDLICPDPVTDLSEARRFEAHFGGALANVAVAAVARRGGDSELAGAAATTSGTIPAGPATGRKESGPPPRRRRRGSRPLRLRTLDEAREPAFRIHGYGIETPSPP